jgi:hypothetical protein
MPFKSGNEGLLHVDDVAGNVCESLPHDDPRQVADEAGLRDDDAAEDERAKRREVDGEVDVAQEQGLTLIPISAQLKLTLPISTQLKLTLSPI